MTTFKYETHLHTAETSRCAASPGADMAHYFASQGYAGVFVTDHFLNGNTTVTPDLPWDERIAMFCHGYQKTAEQGAKLGLDVFFAWEYHYGWVHLLTYGLDAEWLLANPDLLEWNVVDYLDRVRDDGGFVVHAHPFREGVDIVQLMPEKVDAIEVINCARADDANQHARDYATSFGLLQTAGSDAHSTTRNRQCGVETPRRLTSTSDYLTALKEGDAVLFDQRPS